MKEAGGLIPPLCYLSNSSILLLYPLSDNKGKKKILSHLLRFYYVRALLREFNTYRFT